MQSPVFEPEPRGSLPEEPFPSSPSATEPAAASLQGHLALAVALHGPLSMIVTAASALHRRLGEAPTLDELTRIQQEASGRMLRVLDNVMDLWGPVRPWLEPTPVGVVLSSALANVRLTLGQQDRYRSVALHVPSPAPVVLADPVLLSHTLINVLANAFDHGDAHGKIEASVERSRGSQVRINVVNDGPTIPRHHLERVFEPFFTTRHATAGLGLAATRRLMNAMQGSITLECSRQGVRVSLFFDDAEASARSGVFPAAPSGT
jgi:two-component system sensor histidine kinase KdpD